MKKVFVLLGLFILSFHSFSQMIVTTANTPAQLVSSFILNGVSASNITYAGGTGSLGSFTGGNSTNLGMNEGIILSTGLVNGSPAINSAGSNHASTANNGGSNVLLQSLIPGYTINDASVLEFDLVPVGNMFDFKYVFASEEYPEFVNIGFNDVFGFFISGVNPIGGNYVNENIALIPGSNAPVCIDNVNAVSNAMYYNDNTSGTSIVFDGFTDVMTAQLPVVPGATYHLVIAVGDAGDQIYDSGIFLKAQSMKSYMITDVAENDNTHLTLSSNPLQSDGMLKFNLNNGGQYHLNIMDLSGKNVFSTGGTCSFGGQQQVSLSDFYYSCPDGIYVVRLSTDEFAETMKVVK